MTQDLNHPSLSEVPVSIYTHIYIVTPAERSRYWRTRTVHLALANARQITTLIRK